MELVFIVAAVFGALAVANSLRPLNLVPFRVGAFFAGWLTAELAPQLLVVHLVVVAAFVSGGAATPWALGITAFTAVGLVTLIVQSQRAKGVILSSLEEGLGREYLAQSGGETTVADDLRLPWRQLLLPFKWWHREVTRVRNLSYGPYGRRNKLDVYLNHERPQGAPILLQIHGGAWIIGNKEQQGRPLLLHMAAQGWVCVSINYRLSPRSRFPDHLVDVKRAIAWIREHAAEFGGDPSFLVVTGGSAGGHLTAMAALTANMPAYQPGFEDADTSVQAAVPYYGVYDVANEMGSRYGQQRLAFLMERLVLQCRFADDREPFDHASPVWHAGRCEDVPPIFLIHGSRDSLVPVEEARHFVELLRQASSAPVVYAELPGAQHAFDIFASIRTAHVLRGVERFCRYVLAAATASR